MIQSIIFDFDGVILESTDIKVNAFQEMYKEYGEETVEKVTKHHLENGGISRFVKFKYYHETFLNQKITEKELKLMGEKFSKIIIDKILEAPFVEGALEFLENNFKNYRMYISSGTPETELLEIIKKKRIEKYFENIYGSPKTKKEHIKEILTKGNYLKNNVLFVGDSTNDKEAAESSGIHFVGRITEHSAFSDKDFKINNLNELKNIIQQINIKNLIC